ENSFDGIIEIDKKNLLQPFARGKNAEEFKLDGMGLGLSIVQKASDLGDIEYDIVIDREMFIVKLKMFNEKK
ncbi:MAG: sensor histidine kinase, partial [Cetobacterium sp.]